LDDWLVENVGDYTSEIKTLDGFLNTIEKELTEDIASLFGDETRKFRQITHVDGPGYTLIGTERYALPDSEGITYDLIVLVADPLVAIQLKLAASA
jgi:hypothetical protein